LEKDQHSDHFIKYENWQKARTIFWSRGEAGQRGQVAAEPLGEAECLEGPCAPAKFQRTGAVYDLRVLTQFWCNPVCLTAQIFTSARACRHQALARTPSQGTTHHTDYLAGSLGLSCVRGARTPEVTEDGNTSDQGAA